MLKNLLILLILPIIFCSCSKNDAEIINFSSWGSITEVKILEKVISDFEQKNPDIKINFIHIPQNYFQKLHLLFASSTEPDVIFINSLYLPVYENKLENLTDIIDKNEYYIEPLEALSSEGRLLAIPRDISNFIFFYNKNITGELNPDWTFSDFDKLIKEKKKDKWSVSFERDVYWASPYTLTLGFYEGIKYYKSLEGIYAPSPSDVGSSTLAQMFLEGKIGLYLSGRWMYPKIKENADFPFGIITFPGYVSADASGWAISKNSKHKEASVKFVKYLSSKECIDYFTNTGLIVPARKDSSELIKETAFLKAIKKSKPSKIGKDYNKERDMLNKLYF